MLGLPEAVWSCLTLQTHCPNCLLDRCGKIKGFRVSYYTKQSEESFLGFPGMHGVEMSSILQRKMFTVHDVTPNKYCPFFDRGGTAESGTAGRNSIHSCKQRVRFRTRACSSTASRARVRDGGLRLTTVSGGPSTTGTQILSSISPRRTGWDGVACGDGSSSARIPHQ